MDVYNKENSFNTTFHPEKLEERLDQLEDISLDKEYVPMSLDNKKYEQLLNFTKDLIVETEGELNVQNVSEELVDQDKYTPYARNKICEEEILELAKQYNVIRILSRIWFDAKVFSYWSKHATQYEDNQKEIDFEGKERWFVNKIDSHIKEMKFQIEALEKIAFK